MTQNLTGNVILNDGFSPQLKAMASSMAEVVTSMHEVSTATDTAFDDDKVTSVKVSADKLKDTLREVDDNTKRSASSQEKHNRTLKEGKNASGGLLSSIKAMVGAYATLQTVKAFVGIADEVSQVNSRLAMMNDGMMTSSQLQEAIFDSAQRSRGSYMETADTIAKLGMQTEGLFKTNEELIQFSEVLNKQFVIGGTGLAQQQSAMLQLTQAMGSGVLRGEEFNAIFEASPGIMKLIAKEMNVSVGELRKMSQEGKITADVVKDALLNAVEDTNKAFESMPKTFAQHAQGFKNEMIMALQPLTSMFSTMINSSEFEAVMGGIMGFLKQAVTFVQMFAAVTGMAIRFVIDNWDWLSMVVSIVLGAMIVYLISTKTHLIWVGIAAVASAVRSAAAFMIMNAKLLLIGAAIGFIIWVLLKMGVTASDVFGFVGGVAFATGTIILNIIKFIGNVFIAFIEGAINKALLLKFELESAWYSIQLKTISALNTMNQGVVNFINSGIRNFEKFVNFWIQGINKIVDGINSLSLTLPNGETIGMNLNHVQEVSLGRIEATNIDSGGLTAPTQQSISLGRLEYGNVRDAYNEGSQAGKNLFANMQNTLGEIKDKLTAVQDPGELGEMSESLNALNDAASGGSTGGIKGKTAETAKNTKDISDELKRANENLEYLKSAAEARAITNISWDKLDVKINNSFGDVHKTADLDGWLGNLNDTLNEVVQSGAGGVLAT